MTTTTPGILILEKFRGWGREPPGILGKSLGWKVGCCCILHRWMLWERHGQKAHMKSVTMIGVILMSF